MPDDTKEIEYDPKVDVVPWPKAEEGKPENRSWAFFVGPHLKGKLMIYTPKLAYEQEPMTDAELAILMATLEHLQGLVALMLGLVKTKEQ